MIHENLLIDCSIFLDTLSPLRYVGQVDYESTVEELRSHFAPCGTINRVTIICDKITGQSKGFAYIEFVDKESAEKALELDESTFRGRQLKVGIFHWLEYSLRKS